MIKKLIIVFTILLAFNIQAQQTGSVSPYSFFGLGNLNFEGTAENRSMGGLSVYTDSIHFNFRNPASYTGENLQFNGYEGKSRPIKFTVGGSSSNVNLENQSTDFNTSTTTFDYLGFSFPVGKFGVGFGLLPFTSVGYELESIADTGLLANRFSGNGGVNRTFVGVGYHVSKNLNVGVNLNYNFGDITNNATEFLFDDQGAPLQTQTREINTSALTGFNYNIGVTYTPQITEKLQLSSSLTFSPESDLSSDNVRNLASINTLVDNSEIVFNTIEVDLDALGLRETDLTLPSKISLGLGIGSLRKWFAGVEYTMLKTSNFSNRTFTIDNASFEDATTIALGGFYIPRYDSFNYWKRIVYRAGFNYEKTGLIINNEPIDEFGISFGVGLPVGTLTSVSNANVGFELGQRGTTDQNLIQENFINVRLSLSLNARWFRKRQFD